MTRASAFFVIDAQVPEVGRSPVSGEPVVPVAPDRPVIAIPHGIGPSPSAAPTMAPNLVLGTSVRPSSSPEVAILRARGAPLFSARAPPFPPPPPPHVNVQEYYFVILRQLEQTAGGSADRERTSSRLGVHAHLIAPGAWGHLNKESCSKQHPGLGRHLIDCFESALPCGGLLLLRVVVRVPGFIFCLLSGI